MIENILYVTRCKRKTIMCNWFPIQGVLKIEANILTIEGNKEHKMLIPNLENVLNYFENDPNIIRIVLRFTYYISATIGIFFFFFKN